MVCYATDLTLSFGFCYYFPIWLFFKKCQFVWFILTRFSFNLLKSQSFLSSLTLLVCISCFYSFRSPLSVIPLPFTIVLVLHSPLTSRPAKQQGKGRSFRFKKPRPLLLSLSPSPSQGRVFTFSKLVGFTRSQGENG